MNEITFPGLGLAFEIKPIAFTVFGWDVYKYGVIIACGFLLALMFCLRIAEQFGIEKDDVLDMLIIATPTAIIGARIYYVLFYLDNFRKSDGSLDVLQMIRIHDGGIAIYGAIIFGLLAAWLVTKSKKVSFLAMADMGAFGLLIGQMVGRWGNFVNVEAYGRETTLPWRMGIMDRMDGVLQYIEVHPTFLYESLWNAIGFIVLFIALKQGVRRFDGMLFCAYVAWYGMGRVWIEGLRTDSLYLFATGIRVSQLLALTSAIVSIAYILYRLQKNPNIEELYVNKKK